MAVSRMDLGFLSDPAERLSQNTNTATQDKDCTAQE